jgi:hypothetical protein
MPPIASFGATFVIDEDAVLRTPDEQFAAAPTPDRR